MEPLITHQMEVAAPGGGRRRVLASFWRIPAVTDVWRLEVWDVGTDEHGEFFTPRPDLAMEIDPEQIGDAEADRRRSATIQRAYAAPHLALASAYDMQADVVAELAAELPSLGVPGPERAPAPTPPAEVAAPTAKVRQPSPGAPPPGAPEE